MATTENVINARTPPNLDVSKNRKIPSIFLKENAPEVTLKHSARMPECISTIPHTRGRARRSTPPPPSPHTPSRQGVCAERQPRAVQGVWLVSISLSLSLSRLRRDCRPDSGRLSVTVSVGSPLCPCGLPTVGSWVLTLIGYSKSIRCPMCGLADVAAPGSAQRQIVR